RRAPRKSCCGIMLITGSTTVEICADAFIGLPHVFSPGLRRGPAQRKMMKDMETCRETGLPAASQIKLSAPRRKATLLTLVGLRDARRRLSAGIKCDVDYVMLNGFDHRDRSAAGAELLHRVLNVEIDGIRTDRQDRPDIA